MNQKKRTVFQQVLTVNMILSMIFLCIYTLNYIYVNYKFNQENEKYSRQILRTIEQNYQSESVRLSTFMEMCVADRSFVLALSNKLPAKLFVEYGKEVSEKLSMIQYSLPYAENIYAYIKSNQKFILPQYAIVDKELIIAELAKKINIEASEMPDFDILDNGFYTVNAVTFYVYNYLDYGSIIIIVNTERFCEISSINAMLPIYNVVILDKDDCVFATSSEEALLIVNNISQENDSLKYVTYNDERYSVFREDIANGYSFILTVKTSIIQQQQQNNLILIAVGVFLFIGCLLMIYLNSNIYRPLKTITRKLMPVGEKGNEIDFIYGKMNEIMKENLKMQNQISSHQKVQADIELNYALLLKQEISDDLAKHLESQYGQYRMVSVAVQNQVGSGDDMLSRIDDYFMDVMECKSMIIDQFVHAYIISAVHDTPQILSTIDQYFTTIKPNTLVFIGISDRSDDFKRINEVYQQSSERMLNNIIPIERRYAITLDDTSIKSVPARISGEILNTVTKHTLNGTAQDIQEIFEHIFFSESNISLQDCKSFFLQLSGVLMSLISQNNTVIDNSDLKSLQNDLVYNPVFMYYLLLEDYKKINEGTSKTYTSLRYEIINYINQHYMDALSLDSISAVFGITPVYLSSWFKKNTGINISIFITNIRMEKAKELLIENRHVKITEIAAMVGIPGTSTFIRQFKNYTGCTPDQYRQLTQDR